MDHKTFIQKYESLPQRRKEVLQKLLEGGTYSAIAQSLGIAEGTLRKHISLIYKDFGVTYRELASLVAEHKPELYHENAKKICVTHKQDPINNDELYLEPEKLQDCYNKIVKPGALIRIRGPKKMGKTLLINKILQCANEGGYQTVKLNILQPEKAVIENLKSLLLWLCSNVARHLKISEQVTDIWKDYRGANDNCTIYFEECILDKIDQPLVLGLDNVDRVFEYPDVAADFFGLLRSWFEDAKVIDVWKKMRLVVAYSTEVYIPLNINNSPFNVGELFELTELNAEQVGLLAKEYNLNLELSQINKLMVLVGGHPYLVKTALENLKDRPDVSLDELLLAAPTNAGIYRDYLTEISQYLQNNPELATALKKVVEAENAVWLADEEAFKLDSLGLIRKYGNDVTWRCDLYGQYFADRLI